MFTFACPSCRERSDWQDDWVGERVDCPSCHEPMKLTRPRRDRDDDHDRLEVVSRRRWEDDDEEDRPRSRRRRDRDSFVCIGCDYHGRPDLVKEMSDSSWILIVIGILFWPLIVIGILMKDTWEVCPDCRRRVRKVSGPSIG